ncbi:hypothetical protein [Rhodococcoides kroppenstedtii]|uniref:hypothetical protein n=1 Tax=Rhodococcoides kroppenstedtii TaxID=293050 RepID=UPI001427C1A6|nr:hypothetical protein [Rhodococcus kroppenstedtii]NIL81463.1 hypothetical protein [Rhodococcus kroppenstedtii]
MPEPRALRLAAGHGPRRRAGRWSSGARDSRDTIATARLIPKRGPATEIRISYRNNALENQR